MPVRSRIHSSVVSMIFSRSVLWTTRAGRYEPVPMIRAFINGPQAAQRAACCGTKALFLVGSVGARFDHALAAIETIGRDAMTQVCFTGLRIDGQGRRLESVVRTMHTARGGSLATLLNWHFCISPKSLLRSTRLQQRAQIGEWSLHGFRKTLCRRRLVMLSRTLP